MLDMSLQTDIDARVRSAARHCFPSLASPQSEMPPFDVGRSTFNVRRSSPRVGTARCAVHVARKGHSNTRTSQRDVPTPAWALVLALAAILAGAGCASTRVVSQERLVNERLPRPDHILVYNFGATPADVPADSALTTYTKENPAPQSPEEIAKGRDLGAQMSSELIERIRDMGMPAMKGLDGMVPQLNDIV